MAVEGLTFPEPNLVCGRYTSNTARRCLPLLNVLGPLEQPKVGGRDKRSGNGQGNWRIGLRRARGRSASLRTEAWVTSITRDWLRNDHPGLLDELKQLLNILRVIRFGAFRS